MSYFVFSIIGFIGGAICTIVALDKARRRLLLERSRLTADEERVREVAAGISTSENQLNEQRQKLNNANRDLENRIAAFDVRAVSYAELQSENNLLKRDLRNTYIGLRKMELDHQSRQSTQASLDQRSADLAQRYLKDNVKWISSALNPNNFANCKQRLQDVIDRCRNIGFAIPAEEETALIAQLRAEFERVVRVASERERQAKLKAALREDQQRQREIDREQARLEHERALIATALAAAMETAKEAHSEEIETLKAQLADAELRSQRAVAQAQLTKEGHVYVISNIGSFGENIFKIGMTRRLDPIDRIRELGDASVPFPFDIHMLISCEDAPALECALHKTLHKQRINRANPRKEFFKADIETISRIVEENHGEVEYVADAEALEYRQSLTMSDEDQEFIEGVYEEAEEELGEPVGDEA